MVALVSNMIDASFIGVIDLARERISCFRKSRLVSFHENLNDHALGRRTGLANLITSRCIAGKPVHEPLVFLIAGFGAFCRDVYSSRMSPYWRTKLDFDTGVSHYSIDAFLR